jgi:hypothetical protein
MTWARRAYGSIMRLSLAFLLPLVVGCGSGSPDSVADARPPSLTDAGDDPADAAQAIDAAVDAAPDASLPDPEAAEVHVEALGATAFREDSAGVDFEVWISRRPSATVTVTVTTSAGSFAQSTTQILSWPNGDTWDDHMIVHVNPIRDPYASGNHDGVLSFAIRSADPDYGVLPPVERALTVVDIDTVALRLTPVLQPPQVQEGHCIAIEVGLLAHPTAPVTIGLEVDDETAASPSPAELILDTALPLPFQRFLLCGLDGHDRNVEVALRARVTASQDAGFAAASPTTLTVTVIDVPH